MIALTEASLEQMILNIQGHLDDSKERIALRPTKLIMAPFMYRSLCYRRPVRKARGVRGRKRALAKRRVSLYMKLLRS